MSKPIVPVDALSESEAADELARLSPGRRKAHAIDDVVEAAFQHLEQGLARGTRTTGGLLVVVAKLTLKHTIHATQLLLLSQLDAVPGQPRLALALDAARGRLELALGFKRPDAALQEQVSAFATRQLALGTEVTSHGFEFLESFRRGASWAAGSRYAGSA